MSEPCDWYLIHTKVRQERCAQENLERQGYTLFSRHFFICLDAGLKARAGPLSVSPWA